MEIATAGKAAGRLSPVKWLHPGICLERDAHFLCYQLCRTVLLFGLAVLAVLLLDIWLRTGLFFDPEAFQKNKLLLPIEFSKIMGPAAFGMTILFYLRARLSINLRNDELLVLMHKAILLGYSRRRWILRSMFVVGIGLPCLFLAHIVVIRFTLHFNMQDSLSFILLPQLFLEVGGLAGVSFALMSYSLVFEKTIRFFPHLEHDLQAMANYQRQP